MKKLKKYSDSLDRLKVRVTEFGVTHGDVRRTTEVIFYSDIQITNKAPEFDKSSHSC